MSFLLLSAERNLRLATPLIQLEITLLYAVADITTVLTGIVSAIPFAGPWLEKLKRVEGFFPPRRKGLYHAFGGLAAVSAWAWVHFEFGEPSFIWVPPIWICISAFAVLVLHYIWTSFIRRKSNESLKWDFAIGWGLFFYVVALGGFSYAFNTWERQFGHDVFYGEIEFAGRDRAREVNVELHFRTNIGNEKRRGSVFFDRWYSLAVDEELVFSAITLEVRCEDLTKTIFRQYIVNPTDRELDLRGHENESC